MTEQTQTPNFNAKVKTMLDAARPGPRVCDLTGEAWEVTDEEIAWQRKFNSPLSPTSPLARARILAGFGIGYQLWWHKHAENGEPLFSYVHPASGVSVLPDREWFERDFASQGRAFDHERPFFEQFRELQLSVPMLATKNTVESKNSISIGSYGDENSYFTHHCVHVKDSFYITWSGTIEKSALMHNVGQGMQSYHVDDSYNVFNSRFVRDSSDILNSAFVFSSVDCEYCFGAAGQRHKKYIFFNKQLTKDEYAERIRGIDLKRRSDVEAYTEKFDQMLANDVIWPQNNNFKSQESDGEYLINAVRCRFCYQCVDSPRDMYWSAFCSADTHDNAFCQYPHNTSDCFMSTDLSDSMNCRFSVSMTACQDMEYCMQCLNCEHCFGCVGLQRKQFHIFNQPYAEADYWAEVDRIKTQMLAAGAYGRFFPLSFSPTYFLQSSAALYFAATPEEGAQLGAQAYDPESHGAIGADLADAKAVRRSSEIPDSIEDMDVDEWAGVPVMDETSRRRFAFLRPELEFYKRYRIAPPNRHFVHRMQDLIEHCNSAILERTACAKCGAAIDVGKNRFYPKRTIYCLPCYHKFIDQAS